MPTDSQQLATAKRRREVIQLREAGASWEAIADTIEERYGADALPKHWSKRYAHKDFQRALGKVQDEVKDRARTVRELELKRLDRMQRGLWQSAINGDTDAARTIVRLMKRRAALLGLDEPERFDVSVTDAGDIEWDALTDEQLERIAEGEPLREVLADEQLQS